MPIMDGTESSNKIRTFIDETIEVFKPSFALMTLSNEVHDHQVLIFPNFREEREQ